VLPKHLLLNWFIAELSIAQWFVTQTFTHQKQSVKVVMEKGARMIAHFSFGSLTANFWAAQGQCFFTKENENDKIVFAFLSTRQKLK